MRIVDMMFFRVSRILIIFVVLISLLNRICKSRQFEHANNTCRIVMTSWSHEHVSEITSNTQRSFRNKLKFIFFMRSYVSRALYDLCLSLCSNMFSTWSSMLIVVNASHSCHCFIVILISFWLWCVSTSSRRRSLVVSRVTLTICKHSLLRCLRSHCFESFCVLIFIEALNLRRASVSSRMLSECALIVFDRCLTSLIELFWVMSDCLSTFYRLCFYTRSQ